MKGEGEGSEGTSLTPPPSIFFYSRSNFCAIKRLETLATQARYITSLYLVIFVHVHRIHSQVWVLCSELSQKYFVSFVLSLCPLTNNITFRC